MIKTCGDLLQSRDELMQRMALIGADLGQGPDADSREQAIQLENIDVLSEISRISEEELKKINDQLAALKEND
jgi:hypothetical protein